MLFLNNLCKFRKYWMNLVKSGSKKNIISQNSVDIFYFLRNWGRNWLNCEEKSIEFWLKKIANVTTLWLD